MAVVYSSAVTSTLRDLNAKHLECADTTDDDRVSVLNAMHIAQGLDGMRVSDSTQSNRCVSLCLCEHLLPLE